MNDSTLKRLRALRESNDLARRGLLARVEARGDTDLTAGEAAKFEAVTAAIKDVDQQIREAEAEYVRSGRGNPDIAHVLKATTRTEADDWAQRAFDRLSESRALVSSGSVLVAVGHRGELSSAPLAGFAGRCSAGLDWPALTCPRGCWAPFSRLLVSMPRKHVLTSTFLGDSARGYLSATYLAGALVG